jgi:hypothetical protein
MASETRGVKKWTRAGRPGGFAPLFWAGFVTDKFCYQSQTLQRDRTDNFIIDNPADLFPLVFRARPFNPGAICSIQTQPDRSTKANHLVVGIRHPQGALEHVDTYRSRVRARR